jgi:response regulator RpfG family c-di-GMP phosphodiesterase
LDALGNVDPYGNAWLNEHIWTYFESEKGQHFAPSSVYPSSVDPFFEVREG